MYRAMRNAVTATDGFLILFNAFSSTTRGPSYVTRHHLARPPRRCHSVRRTGSEKGLPMPVLLDDSPVSGLQYRVVPRDLRTRGSAQACQCNEAPSKNTTLAVRLIKAFLRPSSTPGLSAALFLLPGHCRRLRGCAVCAC